MGENRSQWYAGGLHFECVQCGRCCAGPGQGFIWVTKPEIELIADYLKINVRQLRAEYLRRVGFRTTIIEDPGSRDCIFLKESKGARRCLIYHVRPSQCRSWPFWPSNLANSIAWNEVAQKCAGVNRGKHYRLEEIERIQRNKKWWQGQ